MDKAEKSIEEKLNDSYLHVIHSLQFEKNENKTPAQIAEIERQILFTKCHAAAKIDALPPILEDGLNTYTDMIDKTTGVNNYWKEIKDLNLDIKNDPSKWVSGLQDVSQALKFLKPLPCQSDVTASCKDSILTDRHIEKFMAHMKGEEDHTPVRKIATNKSEFQDNEMKSSIAKPQATFRPVVPNREDPYNMPSTSRQHSSNQEYSRNPQNSDEKIHASKSFLKIQKPNKVGNVPNIETSKNKICGFKTAREELNIQLAQKNRQQPQKKTLGGKSSVRSKYVCPLKQENDSNAELYGGSGQTSNEGESDEFVDERLKGIEPKMIELIKNEIMDSGSIITWNDIAGLEYAKKIIKEIVVFPMLRPDIFTGLRRPPKGILLFGPPGTGKTLIGKCIASQSKSTFFSISASSLTSKWIGEGEKMVRALFAVARVYQPSVVFIDEIDSLLTQRSETEHESSRRIKTEFLVQLDGAATAEEDRILIVGATNRPYELDEAARRRLVKRLYIPLPECQARGQIVANLLKSEKHDLTPDDINEIAKLTEGYSGADVTNLCKEASMGPIRSIPFSQLENISKDEVRQVTMQDFIEAVKCVRPSVSPTDLCVYLDWDKTYGTGSTYKN